MINRGRGIEPWTLPSVLFVDGGRGGGMVRVWWCSHDRSIRSGHWTQHHIRADVRDTDTLRALHATPPYPSPYWAIHAASIPCILQLEEESNANCDTEKSEKLWACDKFWIKPDLLNGRIKQIIKLSPPVVGVLEEPYSAKPAQRSSHTGPPGYLGWTLDTVPVLLRLMVGTFSADMFFALGS